MLSFWLDECAAHWFVLSAGTKKYGAFYVVTRTRRPRRQPLREAHPQPQSFVTGCDIRFLAKTFYENYGIRPPHVVPEWN
jgi:hypothetical protein